MKRRVCVLIVMPLFKGAWAIHTQLFFLLILPSKLNYLKCQEFWNVERRYQKFSGMLSKFFSNHLFLPMQGCSYTVGNTLTINITNSCMFNLVISNSGILQCFSHRFLYHLRVVEVLSSARLLKLCRSYIQKCLIKSHYTEAIIEGGQ